jgi:glutamate-5-semialdehyde dehydrogenase
MVTIVATSLSTRDKLLRAREASTRVAELSTARKNAILMVMADAFEANSESIVEANRKDLESSGVVGAMRDRLLLDAGRIRLMAAGVRDVAKLPDPTFETLAEWTRPNGLRIRKVRVPLGVVGIIYESRPNVTVDTVALTFKTGNAVVLRGGK